MFEYQWFLTTIAFIIITTFSLPRHTKNAADRFFSYQKANYRTTDIWTMSQLLRSLNSHKKCSAYYMKEGEFKNYTEFLDLFYDKIESGKCSTGHIFSVENTKPTTMTIYVDDMGTEPPHVQEFKKERRGVSEGDRLHQLRHLQGIKTILSPGIPEIKQMELFVKWRQVVPKEYWKYTCPEPSEGVKERHKGKQNENAKKWRDQHKKQGSKPRKKGNPTSAAPTSAAPATKGPKKKRGRPPSAAAKGPKKKRGRPAKAKASMSPPTGATGAATVISPPPSTSSPSPSTLSPSPSPSTLSPSTSPPATATVTATTPPKQASVKKALAMVSPPPAAPAAMKRLKDMVQRWMPTSPSASASAPTPTPAMDPKG